MPTRGRSARRPRSNDPAFHTVATGCTKVKQPAPAVQAHIDALIAQIAALRGGEVTLEDQKQIDALTGQVLALAQNSAGATLDTVPPDPRRCFLAKDDPFTAPPGPCAHRELDPAALPHDGHAGRPRFEWMRGQIEAAAAKGQYVMVLSHHTLRTIRFPTTDPSEQPAHFGQRVDRRGGQPQRPDGGQTLEELFCQHPNVIAFVAGHEHENYVERHDCADDDPPTPGANPHFWQVSTAAHIDWSQQSRMIELVNLEGKLTLVLTMFDLAGPPDPGNSNADGDVLHLASIARELAYNDYQGSRAARGERQDRNVILPLDRPPPPYTP